MLQYPNDTQPTYLDVELLCDIISCSSEVWESWGVDPDLSLRGRMIGLLYDQFMKGSGKVDREVVERYLRLTI